MSGRYSASVRDAVSAHEPARGKRYDRGLKARIVELAQLRRKEGASWKRIADEVGLPFETVRRWCIATEPKRAQAMVPVRVMAERRTERAVVVTSPGGYRIESLSLHEAIAVLRALG
jgi:transposase-like protein